MTVPELIKKLEDFRDNLSRNFDVNDVDVVYHDTEYGFCVAFDISFIGKRVDSNQKHNLSLEIK